MGRKITRSLRAVEVTVPPSTTIEQGKFYRLDGFVGMALQSVTTGAGQTARVVLEIEPAIYETDQIDTTLTFAVGTPIYWDNAAGRFTETATGNKFAGIVTRAKDANNVIEFALAPQPQA